MASDSGAFGTKDNNNSESKPRQASLRLNIPVISNESPDTQSKDAAKKSNRIILGKGFSLMDWIRFTRETPDLAGNQGVLKRVTLDELAKHNKEDDCWMAIYDKVYNVTPYVKFHPGGVEELMKGAGKNATSLFNDVHPWVNLQSMLEKCLVGHLVLAQTTSADDNDNVSLKSLKLKPKIEVQPKKVDATEIPVLDSYQSVDTINIVLYAKCKNLKPDCVIIDKLDANNPNNIIIHLYTPNGVYKYNLDTPAPTKDEYSVKVSKEGRIEIAIFKIEKIHWWQMCPKLTFSAEIVADTNSGVYFRKCELVKKTKITHDTDVYQFNLPQSSRMCVPLGFHVFLKPKPNENLLVKPYTVINETLQSPNLLEQSGKQLCFMIKAYDKGAVTSALSELRIGAFVEISNFAGTFQPDKLESCNELVLVCAGSGFTPMIRVLHYGLRIESIGKISMLFFNKTSRDVLWRDELQELMRLHPKRYFIESCFIFFGAGFGLKFIFFLF